MIGRKKQRQKKKGTVSARIRTLEGEPNRFLAGRKLADVSVVEFSGWLTLSP